ncbi:MAG: hypothetical protein ABWY08_11560 [Comamonas sp.]
MHRLVLVFLLLLLPVQWTWAAASSICRHESGAASQHFGHHDHRHEAGVSGAAEVQKVSEAGTQLSDLPHADCASCHGAAPALTALQKAPALHHPPRQGATPYLRVVTAGIPERLSRPPHASFS